MAVKLEWRNEAVSPWVIDGYFIAQATLYADGERTSYVCAKVDKTEEYALERMEADKPLVERDYLSRVKHG